jgi:hypothetical protein
MPHKHSRRERVTGTSSHKLINRHTQMKHTQTQEKIWQPERERELVACTMRSHTFHAQTQSKNDASTLFSSPLPKLSYKLF